MKSKKAPSQKKTPAVSHSAFSLQKKLFLYVGCLCLLLVLGFVVVVKLSATHASTVEETPGNEMKKIPQDVQKHLDEQKVTPSLLATVRVPILMYHYVEYVKDKSDTIRQALDVTPNVFEQQMQTLQNAGYSFMTATQLGEVLDGKQPLPPKPILITFDDGHWDLDTVVLPILEKYHIKATAYIVPGFVGTNTDSLTVAQLEDVIKSGLVDIGAHTVHHASLKGQPLPLVQNEVDESKSMLENEFHVSVHAFAYPYGSFDQQAIDVVKADGFTTAVSTIPGIEQSEINRFFLYRLRPGYRTGDELLQFLSQNFFTP